MNIFGIDEQEREMPTNDNPLGVGTEPASEEEQAALDGVMDGIVNALHGNASQQIVQSLKSAPDLVTGVSMIAAPLVQQADMELQGMGQEVPDDIWFAENGAIQQTVELVWEMAEAAGLPGSEDESQLEAAYMQTMSQIGEYLYENDPDSVLEAQEALMEGELGADTMSQLEQQVLASQAPSGGIE